MVWAFIDRCISEVKIRRYHLLRDLWCVFWNVLSQGQDYALFHFRERSGYCMHLWWQSLHWHRSSLTWRVWEGRDAVDMTYKCVYIRIIVAKFQLQQMTYQLTVRPVVEYQKSPFPPSSPCSTSRPSIELFFPMRTRVGKIRVEDDLTSLHSSIKPFWASMFPFPVDSPRGTEYIFGEERVRGRMRGDLCVWSSTSCGGSLREDKGFHTETLRWSRESMDILKFHYASIVSPLLHHRISSSFSFSSPFFHRHLHPHYRHQRQHGYAISPPVYNLAGMKLL